MKVELTGRGAAVLVTGCSSGIGRAVAILLAREGYSVFATVRREENRQELETLRLPNLTVLCPVDMTRDEEIEAATRVLSESLDSRGIGLFAVVNNAGGGRPAPVELIEPQMMRTELTARVAGPIVLLQRTMSLLRRGNGRILWISTPAIIPTPYVAAIHACDFAVNCLSRTLDIELARWKIPSVMIRCGGVRTPAGLRTIEDVERLLHEAPLDRRQLYEEALRRWAEEMAEFDKQRIPPERVAETVLRALRSPRPRRRYAVGHMARLAAVLEVLPQPLTDRILKSRF